MSRYSNSYPEEGAMMEARAYADERYSEPEFERRSLGKELAHHGELSQSLHEQIAQLTEALAPLLAAEPTRATDGMKLGAAPQHCEMVSRAESHSRSLIEAVDRLRDLRDRIEM